MAGDRRELLFDLLARDKASPTFKRVGDAADDMGDEFRQAAVDAAVLEHEVQEAEGSLRSLAVAFARAGTDAERMDLSKAIRRQRAEIRKLGDARDLLPDPSRAGATFATRLGASLSVGLARIGGSLGPAGAAIGAGLAIGATPVLVAAVGAAVVGGAGAGGVVGGMLIASRDARVKAAGQSLAADIGQRLQRSAEPFVPAMINAIGIARQEFGGLEADLRGLFASSARYVEPLTRGAGGFARELVSGFREAADAAGPIIDVVAMWLPRLGSALGDVFRDLADNAVDGAHAIAMVFIAIEAGIRVVGGAINAFTEFYGVLAKSGVLGQQAALAYFQMEAAQKNAAGTSNSLAAVIAALGSQTKATKDRTEELISAFDDLFGRTMSADEAALRYSESLLRLKDGLRSGTNAISRNTEVGQQNRGMVLDHIKAIERMRDANIRNGMSVTDANRKYVQQVAALQATMRQAGFTEKQIQTLTRKYFGLPSKVNTQVGAPGATTATRQTNDFNFAVRRLPLSKSVNVRALTGDAQSKIAAIRNSLARVPGSKTIHINAVADIPAGMSLGALMREYGGPVKKGHAYVVGERRPEVFVPDRDGRIVPSIEKYQSMRGPGLPVPAGTGTAVSGGTMVNVNVYVAPTANKAEVGREVAEALDAYYKRGGRRP